MPVEPSLGPAVRLGPAAEARPAVLGVVVVVLDTYLPGVEHAGGERDLGQLPSAVGVPHAISSMVKTTPGCVPGLAQSLVTRASTIWQSSTITLPVSASPRQRKNLSA